MYVSTEAIKKYLIDLHLVTANDIKLAESQSYKTGDNLTNVLISQAKITEETAQKANAHVLGIPYVNLENKNIPFETLSIIPEIVCRAYNVIAFNKNGNDVEIALTDIDNLKFIEETQNNLNIKFLPRLTNSNSLEVSINKYKNILKNEFITNIEKETKNLKQIINLDDLSTDLNITRIFDLIISYALLENASDIHIEPHTTGLWIRYRNSGKLYNIMSLPHKLNDGIIARIKYLSKLDININNYPQEGRFQIEEMGLKITFRTILTPVYLGEKAVIHIIKENKIGFTLESLGFFGNNLNKIHNVLNKKTGIILSTGPSNSGKTSLLYTMLDMLNNTHMNIATIEDPIEYQLPYINQTQINPDIGLNFPNGIRGILKQDPDILMIGEIREAETANIVFNAGLNGRMILSTMHSNSISETIYRLKQMNVPSFLINGNLKMIINQRLLKRLGTGKEKYFMNDTELIELSKYIDLDKTLNTLKEEGIVGHNSTWREVPFYRANKDINEENAYNGQIIASEVLEINETIKDLINKDISQKEFENVIKTNINMTLLENGIINAIKGETSLEEVFKLINE